MKKAHWEDGMALELFLRRMLAWFLKIFFNDRKICSDPVECLQLPRGQPDHCFMISQIYLTRDNGTDEGVKRDRKIWVVITYY